MSQAKTTEILINEYATGWNCELITATGAEVKTVKSTRGKVAEIYVTSAVAVTLKDNITAKWAAISNADKSFAQPIECAASIKLDFAGAASAWIIYK